MRRDRSRVRRGDLKQVGAAGILAVLAAAMPAAGADIAEAVKLQAEDVQAEIAAQRHIDSLHQQTQALAAEYRRVQRELEQVQAYREQLGNMVAVQRQQLAAVQEQLEHLDGSETTLLPLLAEMADTLAQFVALDLPFRTAERHARAGALQDVLRDPNLSPGEKYRRVMAAFQEEAKYGATLETYRDVLTLDGRKRNVELLRVGRIALLYRTPDGREFGAWDQAQRQWLTLPRDYAAAIRSGFRVADKQVAPELLSIPLPAPQVQP